MNKTKSWKRKKSMTIGSPDQKSFRHSTHVNRDFVWSLKDGDDPSTLFELGERLGRGSFAEVYEVVHKASQIAFAAKIISRSHMKKKDRAALQSEMEILRKCRSPQTIAYYGCLQQDKGDTWVIMELCRGGSARDMLKFGRLSDDEIAEVCQQTVKGLTYLHSINIAHRDIKAANIMLSETGAVKLADFGVSAQLVAGVPAPGSVECAGTPYWMAPEVILQTMKDETKCDIWSLGITVIELADGDPPCIEKTPMQAMYAIPSKPPPTLRDCSTRGELLNEFITVCCNKDESNRPKAGTLLLHPFVSDVRPGRLRTRMFRCHPELNNRRPSLGGFTEEMSSDGGDGASSGCGDIGSNLEAITEMPTVEPIPRRKDTPTDVKKHLRFNDVSTADSRKEESGADAVSLDMGAEPETVRFTHSVLDKGLAAAVFLCSLGLGIPALVIGVMGNSYTDGDADCTADDASFVVIFLIVAGALILFQGIVFLSYVMVAWRRGLRTAEEAAAIGCSESIVLYPGCALLFVWWVVGGVALLILSPRLKGRCMSGFSFWGQNVNVIFRMACALVLLGLLAPFCLALMHTIGSTRRPEDVEADNTPRSRRGSLSGPRAKPSSSSNRAAAYEMEECGPSHAGKKGQKEGASKEEKKEEAAGIESEKGAGGGQDTGDGEEHGQSAGVQVANGAGDYDDDTAMAKASQKTAVDSGGTRGAHVEVQEQPGDNPEPSGEAALAAAWRDGATDAGGGDDAEGDTNDAGSASEKGHVAPTSEKSDDPASRECQEGLPPEAGACDRTIMTSVVIQPAKVAVVGAEQAPTTGEKATPMVLSVGATTVGTGQAPASEHGQLTDGTVVPPEGTGAPAAEHQSPSKAPMHAPPVTPMEPASPPTPGDKAGLLEK